MERRGLGTDADPSDADPLASAQPTLAGLAADSVRGFAPGGGRPARRGDRIDPEDLSAPATPRCAATMGFTLHANVAVPARAPASSASAAMLRALPWRPIAWNACPMAGFSTTCAIAGATARHRCVRAA